MQLILISLNRFSVWVFICMYVCTCIHIFVCRPFLSHSDALDSGAFVTVR